MISSILWISSDLLWKSPFLPGNHLFYSNITFFTEVNDVISEVNKLISEVKTCSIHIFTMNNPPFLLIYHFSGGVKMGNKEKWGVIYIANLVPPSSQMNLCWVSRSLFQKGGMVRVRSSIAHNAVETYRCID